jgi:hypothetical protein
MLHLMHCTKLCSAHLYSYTLDCALAEPESEIQEDQSLGEYGGLQATSCVDTNLDLDQDKTQCIPPIILGVSLNLYNYVLLDCAFKFIEIK